MDTSPLKIPHTSRSRAIIIGVLGIALILILCGLYLWGSLLSTENVTRQPFVHPPNNEPETPRADADIQILRTVSSSNELSSITADLESTNLTGLDKELDLIERDLGR